jgi:hypothetical protein
VKRGVRDGVGVIVGVCVGVDVPVGVKVGVGVGVRDVVGVAVGTGVGVEGGRILSMKLTLPSSALARITSRRPSPSMSTMSRPTGPSPASTPGMSGRLRAPSWSAT